MALIKLDQVNISVGNKEILHNVNLEIHTGEKVMLFGKSGSGKSTLLKAILGLFVIDEGEISICDLAVNCGDAWKARREIAYVSQDTDIMQGKVSDYIREVFRLKYNRKLKPSERDIFDLMDLLELDQSLYSENFEDLSGGEKQRIAILISILLKRKIYLLDEVTAAQDQALKEKIIDFFVNLDAAVLIVSHDQSWLKRKEIKIIELDQYKKHGNN